MHAIAAIVLRFKPGDTFAADLIPGLSTLLTSESMVPSASRSPDLPDLRDWARQKLGLPRDLSSSDTPAALLRRLVDCDFAPARDENDAVDVLSKLETTARKLTPQGYYEARFGELKDEVAVYAERFFRLDPQIRRQTWEQLQLRCAPFPSLCLWLERLKPGLNLELPFGESASSNVATLVRFLCQWFAGYPFGDRSAIELQLTTTFQDRMHWKPAILVLRLDFPDLALLFEPLINQLSLSRPIESPRVVRTSLALPGSAPNYGLDQGPPKLLVDCVRGLAALVVWRPTPPQDNRDWAAQLWHAGALVLYFIKSLALICICLIAAMMVMQFLIEMSI